MRTISNPYTNTAGLPERYIGDAYENVKLLAENIKLLQQLGENLTHLVHLSTAYPSLDIIATRPELLQWIEDHEYLLVDFDQLKEHLQPQKNFEVTIGNQGTTTSVLHGLNQDQKIYTINGTVLLSGDKRIPLYAAKGLQVWVEGLHIKVYSPSNSDINYAGILLNLSIGYKE